MGTGFGSALEAELVRGVGPGGGAFPSFPSRWRCRIADAVLGRDSPRKIVPERGGSGAERGKVIEGNELFRDRPLHSLGDCRTGSRGCVGERKGETGGSGTGSKKGSYVAEEVAPSFPFAPGIPCPSLPSLQTSTLHPHPLERTGCSGHTCTVGLAHASSPPVSGPTMASSQGSGAQDVY